MDIVEAFERSLEEDTITENNKAKEEILFAKKWVEAGLPTSACVMTVNDANEMLRKVSELEW